MLPNHTCPVCNRPLDTLTHLRKDARAKPGDKSVCLYCAAMLVFDVDLSLRLMTRDEWDDHDRKDPSGAKLLKLTASKLKRAASERAARRN